MRLSDIRAAFAACFLAISFSISCSPLYAQITADWSWVNSRYYADGAPSSVLESKTICLDTAGNSFIAGSFLGLTLYDVPPVGASTIVNFGTTTRNYGVMLRHDNAGNQTGSYSPPYSTGNVSASKVVCDKDNNTYVAGTFDGTNFHPFSGSMLLNTSPGATTTDIYINKLNAVGTGLWVRRAGGPSSDVVADMCTDNNNNLYVTGDYTDNFIAFGSDTLKYYSGSNTMFVVKYNTNGTTMWARGVTSKGFSSGTGISTDKQGYLYISGAFFDTLRFGGTTIINPLAGLYQPAAFLAKMDTNGNLKWVKQYNGNNALRNRVVCNSRNQVYLAGSFNGPTMQMGAFTLSNPTPGTGEIFLSKIDSAGNVKWAESFGGTDGEAALGIAADDYDNGYMTGYTQSSTMPCGSATINNLHSGYSAGYVMKFDTAGHVIYANDLNTNSSTGYVIPQAVTVNKRGDVYITGNVKGDSILCSNIHSNVPVAVFPTLFIAKIDSTPNCRTTISALTPATFCAGGSGTIAASGDAGATWQWYQGTTLIAGATNSNYTMNTAATYSVRVTNAWGCTATATITPTINPLPVAGTISGLATVCPGSTITFTATATGGTWSNAFAATGSISSAGIYSGIAAGVDTVKYTVTNACGNTTVARAVTVNPLPAAGTISGPATVCPGSTITFTATVTGGTWSHVYAATGGISGTGTYTGIAAGVDTVKYTVTNTCGNAIAARAVTVNAIPALTSATSLATICNGSPFAYTPTSSVAGTTFAWTRAAVVGITNPAGTGTGGITETLNNSTASTVTTTYVYILSAGGCSDTASITLPVAPTPVAGPITGTTTLCAGATVTLSDTTSGGAWSATSGHVFVSSSGLVNGLSAGVDTVVFNAMTACGPVTATTAVTINALPSAGAITGAAEVCIGNSITLSNIATGGTWSSTNGHALVSSGGVVLGTTAGADNILYIVTNTCGSDTAQMNITVNDCNTTAIDQMKTSQYPVIYPNPAHTSLIITATTLITSVTITDVFGRTVYTREYNAQQVEADISTLTSGVYMAKVNGTYTQRVAKE